MSLWFVGFIIWLVRLEVSGRLFFYASNGSLYFGDFVSFYMSGKIALSDVRAQIYSPAVQLEFYNHVIAPLHIYKSPFAQGTPWFFLLMAPFAQYRLEIAYVLWTLFSLVIGLSGLVLLRKYARQGSIGDIAKFTISVCASYPALSAIRDGQNSWLLEGLMAFFCLFWFRQRDIACGIMLGLTCIKPQYLLFLVVPVLAMLRFKVLVCAGITVAVFVLLSTLVFVWPTVISYPSVLSIAEKISPEVLPTWMASIRGPLSLLLPRDLAFQISSIVMLLAAVFLFVLWRRVYDGSFGNQRMVMAITIVIALITSAHTHVYDLTILAVAAALTVEFGSKLKQAILLRTWNLCLAAYPPVGVVLFIITDFSPYQEIIGVVYFLLNMVLLVCGLQYIFKCSQCVQEI